MDVEDIKQDLCLYFYCCDDRFDFFCGQYDMFVDCVLVNCIVMLVVLIECLWVEWVWVDFDILFEGCGIDEMLLFVEILFDSVMLYVVVVCVLDEVFGFVCDVWCFFLGLILICRDVVLVLIDMLLMEVVEVFGIYCSIVYVWFGMIWKVVEVFDFVVYFGIVLIVFEVCWQVIIGLVMIWFVSFMLGFWRNVIFLCGEIF